MIKSTFAKTKTGEIQLTITIPKSEIKKNYEQALLEIAKEAEIPGFRKGKAPKEVVEQKIDKAKIYEKTIQEVIPKAYIEAVKKHNIVPIVPPKVELISVQEGQDWQFRATTCERPKVILGKYKEEVKKALAPMKLWTPEKGKAEEKQKEPSVEEKNQQVIKTLLEKVAIDLPQILVEEETTRALSSLINQTDSLGLTIDQYLTSIGKSKEQIRAEYRQKVEQELKLQFILDEIVKKENLHVSDSEINELVKATGDEKTKKALNTPHQRTYIKNVLLRRKALDFLTGL